MSSSLMTLKLLNFKMCKMVLFFLDYETDIGLQVSSSPNLFQLYLCSSGKVEL